MTKLAKFCCVIALVITGLPLVAGSLTMGGYTFTTAGSPEWYRVNGYPDPNATAASVTWTVEMVGQTQQATMSTKIAGGGYLTFDWSVIASYNDWMPLSLEIDDEPVAGFNWIEAYVRIGSELSQTNPSFSSADILRAAKSYWETVRLYIPAGTHTVTWRAVGSPYYDYQGSSGYPSYTMIYYGLQEGYAAIKNFSFEKYGPQYDIAAWQEKLFSYRSWVKGDLTRFATVYQKLFATTSQGYKARLLHALTTLTALGENAAVSSIAAQFGFVLDYARLQADGEMKDMPQWPNANLLSDSALPQVKTALDTALADLAAIPSSWTGSFTLTPEELLPLDEPVTIDIADIRYLQAALKAAESVILFTQAQNLETNGAKLKEATAPAKIPVIASRPTPTGALWNNVPVQDVEQVFSYGASLCDEIKVARYGSSVFVRLHKGWGFSAQADYTTLDCEIHLCDGGLNDCLEIESICYWFDSYRDGWGIVEDPIGDRGSLITPILSEEGAYLMLELPCPSVVTQVRFQGLERVQVILSQSFHYNMAMEEFRLGDRMDSYKMYLSQPNALTKVRSAAKLGDAKRLTKEAMVLIREADAKVQNRLDRALHLIEYDSVDTAILLALREKADEIVASFDAPRTFSQSWLAGVASGYGFKRVNSLPEENAICLGGLFSGKFLRGDLPASTSLTTYLPCLPTLKDPTLGGLFPGMTTALWMAAFDERDIRYGNLYDYEPCSDGTVVLTGLAKGVDLGAEFVVPARIDGLEVSGLSSRFFEGCVGLKTVRFEGVNRSWMAPDAFAGAPTGLTITAMPGAGWDHEIGGTYQDVKVVQMAGTCRYLYAPNGDGARTITLLGINESRIASGELTLPASYDGYTVTRLGAAFGRDPAGRPYGLTKVVLPATLLAIEDGAFGQNPLAKIEVASGNPVYRVENGLLIDDANRVVLSIRNQGALVIPEGVEIIGCKAFESVVATSVKFPTTLREIEDQGFARNAFTVGEMDFSQTQLERVGTEAFTGSRLLRTVRFPTSLEICGGLVFCQCTSLTSVYFLGGEVFPEDDIYVQSASNPPIRLTSVTTYVTPDQGWEKICTQGLWQGRPIKMKTTLVVSSEDSERGTVVGGGAFDSGASATLTARPAAGYVFAGWYEGDDPAESLTVDYRTPTAVMTVPAHNSDIVASFIPISMDRLDPIGARVFDLPLGPLDESGVTLVRDLLTSSEPTSFPTVSLIGLPAGLSFDPRTLLLKGAPTKAGWYDVTMTAKNASGYRLTEILHFSVGGVPRPDPLPANDTAGLADEIDMVFGSVWTGVCYDEDPIVLRLGGDVRTATVSGVPAGLEWELERSGGEAALVFCATATKAGKFTLTVNVTGEDGKVRRTVREVYVRDSGSRYLDVVANDSARGTVTGAGVLYAGVTARVTATAKAGFVFAGWYEDEGLTGPWTGLADYDDLDPRTAAAAFQFRPGAQGPGGTPEALYARFIPKAEDAGISILCTPEPIGYPAGIPLRIPVAVDSQSFPTVTAANLPAGLTFDAKKLVVKGTPTTPGEKAVKFTARNVSGATTTAEFVVKVQNYTCSMPLDYEDGYTFTPGVAWTDDPVFGSKAAAEWIGWTVTGLPAGVAFNSRTGVFAGAPTAQNTSYTLTLTRTQDGVTEKGTVTVRTSAYPKLALEAEFDDCGRTSLSPTNGWRLAGAGAYPANKTVTLGVTVPKGWAFAGWHSRDKEEDLEPVDCAAADYRTPALPYVTDAKDSLLVALFIPVQADCLVQDDSEFCELALGEPLELCNGGSWIRDYLRSETLPTASLAGLPPGVTFDPRTLLLKGTPTKAGWYDVTLTAKNASGYQLAEVLHVSVGGVPRPDPLPANDTAGLADEIDMVFDNVWTGVCYDWHPIVLRLGGDVRTATVSGVPAGLEWELERSGGEAALVFSATATKAGKFALTVNVTGEDGKARRTVREVYVRDSGSRYLDVVANDSARGTVTGAGVLYAGVTARVTATAKAGFVFAGWYADEGLTGPWTGLADYDDLDPRTAAAAFQFRPDAQGPGGTPETLYARFIPKAEDAEISILCTPEPIGYPAGVLLRIPVAVDSQSFPTVTAANLPAGLTFDAKKLVVKGTPTTPGEKAVKFTVRNVSGATTTAEFVVKIQNYTCSMPLDYDKGYTFTPGVAWTDDPAFGSAMAAEWIGWTVTGLPAGVAFNSRTGVFTGAPTAQNTSYTLTLTRTQDGVTEKGTVTVRTAASPLAGEINGALLKTRAGRAVPLGSFRLTATDKGAISVAAESARAKYAFSSPCWDAIDANGILSVMARDKAGNVLSLEVDTFANLDEIQLTGTLETVAEGTYEISGQMNAFVRKRYYKAERVTKPYERWDLREVDTATEADVTFAMKTDGTSTLTGKIGGFALTATSAVYLDRESPRTFTAVFTPFVTVGSVRKTLSVTLLVNRDLDEAATEPSGEASLED